MKNQGFSLLELMLVMVIVALFACFAYPGYRESLTRARRIDGQTALLDLAAKMEQYYAQQQTYEGATLGIGSQSELISSNRSAQNFYDLVITKQTPEEFSLRAIPRDSQGRDDKACQTLGLNSAGIKTVNFGPAGSPSSNVNHCWH
ncbi:MAG: prepilin-type N-terminal cleavage/methylation domain-containing protein [Tatlockia sp.]|nr:prepilin-type N-terminal cleavage/methylation domain-containing protein [Tatlockia sp.]